VTAGRQAISAIPSVAAPARRLAPWAAALATAFARLRSLRLAVG